MSAPPEIEKTLLVIAGTRPEILKLAPIVQRLRDGESRLRPLLCFSGQHVELVDSVLGELELTADIDLRSTRKDSSLRSSSLSQSVAALLEALDAVVARVAPSGVLVQGDTNTALAGALVAFHHQIPCFHVEAGLRTTNPYRPFPEEMNRRLVAQIATLHFAPTRRAGENLLREGVPAERILVTGNTIIDTLISFEQKVSSQTDSLMSSLRPNGRMLLVTLHRRENATVVADVTRAVRELVETRPQIDVVWILHLNELRDSVLRDMAGVSCVHLIEPLPYSAFLRLMRRATVILTDSGGVQEEAPAFGVPVLVLREETERPEAVESGAARVVGLDSKAIVAACSELFDNASAHAAMSHPSRPFGDGHASEQIVLALSQYFRANVNARSR